MQKRTSPTQEERMIQNEVDQSIWQAVDNLDVKPRIPFIFRNNGTTKQITQVVNPKSQI